jgi:hypothetical protein
MDSVAQLDESERALLFSETAARVGVAPWVAEKDFWICWALGSLFSLPEGHPSLLFKGGTSLSKVFRVIHRFSEDIDLSVHRGDLGFHGDRDPESASGKVRKQLLKELEQETLQYVAERLEPELIRRFTEVLGPPDAWKLTREEETPNLVFVYPKSTDGTEAVAYASQTVLMEIGARSDHSPAGDHRVAPYAYEHYPDYFSAPHCEVRVLDPRRTFWEKATILHAHVHGGPDRAERDHLARHYYDVFMLSRTQLGRDALEDLSLLERVAVHKGIYFNASWARYQEAQLGTLRLVPPDDVEEVIRKDYRTMRSSGFFYGPDPPEFDAILEGLGELEVAINRHL